MRPKRPTPSWRSRRTALLTLMPLLMALPWASRADTVASLLGNFTINQYCGLKLAGDSVQLHFVVVYGQLPALRELHAADADGDGVTTQAERDAYVEKLAPAFAEQLKLSVDGVALPLHATHWSSSLPNEQGGFSLRLDVELSGPLPAAASAATHALRFDNQNFAGRIGWHEISVEVAPALAVFDTDAYGTSLTGGLTEALQTLPANGPLDERSIRLQFRTGPLPAGAEGLKPRPGAAAPADSAADKSGAGLQSGAVARTPGNADNNWLQAQTRRLIGLISAPHVEPQVAAFALLAALMLGALHAFSPGHGKTIVGAYLIGSRGTPRHALFLGFTVTVTHTLGVFALGFATLFASRYVVPEKLFPVLSLISGLLVLGMGLVLLVQRWRSARQALAPGSQFASLASNTEWRPLEAAQPGRALGAPLAPAASARRHHHDAAHPHTHAPGNALMHSHGGSLHSHLPPGAAGEKVSWRALLALGISGGLVPCPSALVLLLAAVALNKTAYGLVLVVAFSLGLALTLTAVGLMFLYARNRMRQPAASARWPQLLPVASAAAITLIGVLLCYSALSGTVF